MIEFEVEATQVLYVSGNSKRTVLYQTDYINTCTFLTSLSPFPDESVSFMIIQSPSSFQVTRRTNNVQVPTMRLSKFMAENISSPQKNTIRPSEPWNDSVFASPTGNIDVIIGIFLKQGSSDFG